MAFDDEKKRPARKPAGGAGKRDSATGGKGGKSFGKPAGKSFAKSDEAGGEKRFGKSEGRSFDKPKYDGPKYDKPAGKSFGKPGGKPGFKSDRPKSDGKFAYPKPATETAGLEPERISKLLARAGVASRRDVERMIMEGRIRLNGEVLTAPAVNATYADNIEVDGERIRGPERTRLWLYHKPAGLVTTNADPEGRPTVFDNLPEGLPRVMSIGRLDINTEGLLLLTNDGGLARVLELPSTGWLRRYRVRAHGSVDQAKLDQLKDGIAVDGVLYGGIDAILDREQGHNAWITMGLREGKNREIKNVLGAIGLDVNRLIRISYGPFQLGNLPEGQVMEIKGRMLRDQLGPRLIEEAKANFDAPIFDHSGALVVDEDDARPATRKPRDQQDRAPRGDRAEWSDRGDRGDRPQRDRSFGDKPFGAKPARGGDRKAGDREERSEKKIPPRNARNANVWMAPGARPLGEKEAAKVAKVAAKRGPRPEARKPEATVSDRVVRPTVLKVRDEEGQWIRATGDADKKREGDRDRKRGFGDRPRDDRRDDRPRGERSFGDRPFGDRPPREPREGGRDAARPARAFSGKPRSDRDSADRPFGDKPRGKPFGKPSGDKPFGARGGKPGGGKGFGGKPGGGKPGGGKGFGGKPSGGRTGGPRGGKPKG
ncbi:MAG TPA: pseudouridine synthase [Ensifer sp.]|nr:pseudouridine synthase [Ensifer sp.]